MDSEYLAWVLVLQCEYWDTSLDPGNPLCIFGLQCNSWDSSVDSANPLFNLGLQCRC